MGAVCATEGWLFPCSVLSFRSSKTVRKVLMMVIFDGKMARYLLYVPVTFKHIHTL